MARTDRYRDILQTSHLITPITIVGCGAVGRNVALMLASMGFDTLRLIDMDCVDDSNLGTQGWSVGQVGRKKAEALAEEVADKFADCDVDPRACKVEDIPFGTMDRTAVFLCVDSMDVRKHVFDRIERNIEGVSCRYLIDTRMGAQAGYVWPVHMMDADERTRWREGWFPSAEAEPMPCGSRSTLYCASYCASLAVCSFVQMIRGQGTLAKPVHFNLPGQILVKV